MGLLERNGSAGGETPRSPANLHRRLTAMTIAHDAHPSEDHDDTVEAHYASLEREPEACLCYDGWHFLGHVVELADGDEEIEYIRVPCRRCNA
jgi:hypothetical protein